MARGKIVDVVYRTGAGTDKERVEATLIGGDVYVEVPVRPTDLFVSVREVDRNANVIREVRFDKGSVVAIIEGKLAAQTRAKITVSRAK
jgi:DNA-binding response OmpR family regulator